MTSRLKCLTWSLFKEITGCLKNTTTSMLYVLANVEPPSIHRDALVLKFAWKALADQASLLHAAIAVLAKSYRQLQPPTRKSARLNLAPVLVVEQRLTSRKPFQRAAQTLLAKSGEVCPVSANQRKTQDTGWYLCLGQLEAVVNWVPVPPNIKTTTGCKSSRHLQLSIVVARTIVYILSIK